MESTNDFVSKWIFYIPGKKIDNICDEFDIDYDENDVKDAISCADLNKPKTVGESIWLMIMDKLASKLKEDYPKFDEDKFSWYNGGADACDLYYSNIPFATRKELEFAMDCRD